MVVYIPFEVRDSQDATNPNSLVTGATPTFVFFKAVPTGTDIYTPGLEPTITEVTVSAAGQGLYYFPFDTDLLTTHNYIVFMIETDNTLTDHGDRYLSGQITIGDGNITVNLDGAISDVLTQVATVGASASAAATSSATAASEATTAASEAATAATQATAANTTATAIDARLPASPAAVGSAMTLDLTQAIATAQAEGSVGEAFLGARATAFGRVVLSGTALTIYAPDDTTVLKTFTLNDAEEPTSRI